MVFYSSSTGGFYVKEIHGDSMPADSVEITESQRIALIDGESFGKIIVPGPDGFPVLQDPPPYVAPIPKVVTMRQARLALLGAGLLDQVEAAIDALPEPPRTAARIEWDYSSEIFREREFVIQLGTSLGLSGDDMDDLFITAATL